MFFGDYFTTEFDTLIANIYTGARYKFADLRLTLPTECAV